MPLRTAAVMSALLALLSPLAADEATVSVSGFLEQGAVMAPLGQALKPLGCVMRWDPGTDRITVSAGDTNLSFAVGDPAAEVARAGQTRPAALPRAPRYVGRTLHGPVEAICTHLGMPVANGVGTGELRELTIGGRKLSVRIVPEVLQRVLGDATGSVVKFETDKGDIYLTLYDGRTPITVGNFLDLVQRGFYDGLNFHRVEAEFMIQGGCPLGNGCGDPGYTIPDEADRGIIHERGSLSMAKTEAPDSGSCQFFICHVPCPHLDGIHTVFGHCSEGMSVVDAIRVGDKIRKATVLLKSPHADAMIEKAIAARVKSG